jgi:hypothetical protein
MIYTWEVTGMKTDDIDGFQNTVIRTYWIKKGIDSDGNEGTFNGATPFYPDSIDGENFIPYEQLSEEIVLGWIQNYIDSDYEQHINDQIQKQIEDRKSKSPSLPWSI